MILPASDRTTHVIVEPLAFITRLAVPVPKPRANLTRFRNGVFASNSRDQRRVTPAKRGRSGRHDTGETPEDPTAYERRAAMIRAQRLKRVFGIDIGRSAGQPIGTATGCRAAAGYRAVRDEPVQPVAGQGDPHREERADSDVDFLVEFPRGYDLLAQRLPLAEKLADLLRRPAELMPEHELNHHILDRVMQHVEASHV